MRYSRRQLEDSLEGTKFELRSARQSRERYKLDLDKLKRARQRDEDTLIRLGLIPARFLYRSAEASRLVINWTAVNKAVKDLETYESSARGAVLKAELKGDDAQAD